MSYVPGGTWQQSPAQPTPITPNPQASVWWRIGHSSWLLLPILGFNCLAGLGFLYIGLRARRPAWWVPGVVYLAFAWPSFLIVGSTPADSVASDLGAGLFLLGWLVSIVHACVINSSWLRWRAEHQPWYAHQTQAQTQAQAQAWPGMPQSVPQAAGHFPPPSTPPGYGPTYGPGSPVGAVSGAGAYQSNPTSPAGSYPNPSTDPGMPPPADPYASPPLDPDLPPPVDPYFGPLPGQEMPASPPRYYG
ncbi:hypothetical protein ACFP2T_03175 [Plantactinospora solaniradicis]|uniref:Uncharacterized protein n=1 Tax=Plantactinospora solaniradicis TaxID=1723736 RepID=A0ABW1K1B0_9ACTN